MLMRHIWHRHWQRNFWETGERCFSKLCTEAQNCSWHLEKQVEVCSPFCHKIQLSRFLGSASQVTYCELMQLNITSVFLGRREKGEHNKRVWVEVSQVQLNSGTLLLKKSNSQRSCCLSGQTAGKVGRMGQVPQNLPPLFLCPLECLAGCLFGWSRYEPRNLGQIWSFLRLKQKDWVWSTIPVPGPVLQNRALKAPAYMILPCYQDTGAGRLGRKVLSYSRKWSRIWVQGFGFFSMIVHYR